MNTLIDTKIKEYETEIKKYVGCDSKCHLVTEKSDDCTCGTQTVTIPYLLKAFESSLQHIEKQTREEEAKAYAKGLKIICEKYPSLATEIKAILYDELKKKK